MEKSKSIEAVKEKKAEAKTQINERRRKALRNKSLEAYIPEEIQEIAEEFKDKDARLEAISQNTGNIKEALQNELEKVTQAEETIANTLKELESKMSQKNSFPNISDFGEWWNGSHSGF